MDVRNKADVINTDVLKDDASNPREHQVDQGTFIAGENPFPAAIEYTLLPKAFSPELIEKAEIILESNTFKDDVPQPDPDLPSGSGMIRGLQHAERSERKPEAPVKQTSLDMVTGNKIWGPPAGAHGKLEDIGIANAGSEYSRFQ